MDGWGSLRLAERLALGAPRPRNRRPWGMGIPILWDGKSPFVVAIGHGGTCHGWGGVEPNG